MTEENVKCPICGTMNKQDSETCVMCKTRLTKKEGGGLAVKSPKSRPKTHIMIDIEDPLTRKKLEELTLIPGVTRKKALLLYQSGIHSIEDFMMKAFQGERFSVNYSRTVANKLLVQSLGNKKKNKNAEILCPSCKAPNPLNSRQCKVCNFDIETDMKSVDITEISDKLNDSVRDILEDLKKSEDFESMSEDMKSQFAALIGSDDVDFEIEKPVNLESLGIDLDKLDEEQAEPAEAAVEKDAARDPNTEVADESKPDTSPTKDEEAAEPTAKTDAAETSPQANKENKIRQVLTDKMIKWRKAGYDVNALEPFLDDVEGFKLKAKEVLGNGKVVKQRYLNQMDMWREKGFNVSELEPILESDVDLFPESAKKILKKQKK